jgi:hypothetical protein
MTSADLVSTLRTLGPQDLSVLFGYLADHLYELHLADGRSLSQCDIIGVKECLLELAAAANKDQPEGVLP